MGCHRAFGNESPGEVPLIRPHKVLHTGLSVMKDIFFNPAIAHLFKIDKFRKIIQVHGSSLQRDSNPEIRI